MIPARHHLQRLSIAAARHAIHQPVLLTDPPRPPARQIAAGVEWVRPPATHDYGRVAVFKDLYGNLWDLVQYADAATATSAAT